MADDMPGRRRAQGRIGSVIKDKWRIDARLGAGGMATVYAATHRNGNRVAIKMLHVDFSRDPQVRTRFLREGYVANAIGHHGAVKILDDDTAEDGCVFLVMELLEGESLESRRERLGGKMPVDEVFTVGDQLLDLLVAAHNKGIVHRDIKPENVFVTNDGAVKVLDFGIAQMRQAGGMERTGTGLMLGTPDFMSPEQAGGHPDEIDARSDLWALGATMFTLLSGESVHTAETLRDHLIATATKPARSLATVAPLVPPQLVTVIDRALELDKERRWPDARAMQDALRWAYKSASQPYDGDSITVMHVAPASERSADGGPRLSPLGPDSETVPSSDAKTVTDSPAFVPGAPPPAHHPQHAPHASSPQAPRAMPDARPRWNDVPAMATRRLVPLPVLPQPPPATVNPGSGSAPTAQPGMPSAHMAPPMNAAAPSTLGAQFTDPRRTTGATPARSRFLLMAFIVLVSVLAGLATFLVATNKRDRPVPPRNATPPPSASAELPAASRVLPAPAPPGTGSSGAPGGACDDVGPCEPARALTRDE